MQDIEDKERYINTGRLIHILSNQMKRRNASEAVGDDGLTTMQKHVLKHILLETMHREVYQKDIEEEFQIRKSTATGILQLMEKNGFISRESSKKDARLKRIVPTPKAEALRPEILEHIRETEKRLIQGIDQEDVKICRKVLVQIGADRGNAAVAGLEGEGLGCTGGGSLSCDGAGGTGLEHDVVGAGGDHLSAVAGWSAACASGGIRGQCKHCNGGGGYHRAAGGGNGGFAGGYAGHAAKAVYCGNLLVRGGQGDGGVVGGGGGAHLQRSRHRVAHIDGVGGEGKVHLGHDHGGVHGHHDGVGADLVAGGCCNSGGANAHSLYHDAAAYSKHAAVIGQKDHSVSAVTGLDHGGQLLGSAQQHIGRQTAGKSERASDSG